MDRKIELDSLSEETFQEVMNAVNTEVLKIAKEAQDKINELLLRFNIRCELALAYLNITVSESAPIEPEKPIKKKRAKKKKEVLPTKE